MTTINEMKDLVSLLNKYRDAYYNQNTMLITDKQYDDLFDKLLEIEKELGTTLSNSPTQTVGYVVQSELKKVVHSHPMLSLSKTKDINDITEFAEGKQLIGMLKMDGLTCSLHYDEKGDLVSAETRGNGEVGEDIFNNAKCISNIPLKINNDNKPLTIDGEVIVDYATFNNINKDLPKDKQYSHPRNLASGSIRQLDTKITADRKLKFIAWRVIEGIDTNDFCESLRTAKSLGFEIVPYQFIIQTDSNSLEKEISFLKNAADIYKYPYDGMVFAYNDMAYGNSLGMTGHHPKHSIAFKLYNEVYETTLRDIEWQVGRSGLISPVAVFDEVDLDGALTNRATLHNVSIIKELQLGIGDKITVFRANEVIPKVNESLTKKNDYVFPTVCPCCGAPTEIRQEGIAEMLFCTNPNCTAKMLANFVHFVSKPCMNINGLSESTLEKFINAGFIKKYADIYHLSEHQEEIKAMDGFGEKSVTKLLKEIEKSRKVKLSNYINALGIDLIGKSASKTIANTYQTYDEFMYAFEHGIDFSLLPDFGEAMAESLNNWYYGDHELDEDLQDEMTFEEREVKKMNTEDNFVEGKTFVVTGKFVTMKRSELEDMITNMGGKLSGSVSKKTDYLLTNDTGTGTSKNKKAAELNIPIMTEQEFLEKVGK